MSHSSSLSFGRRVRPQLGKTDIYKEPMQIPTSSIVWSGIILFSLMAVAAFVLALMAYLDSDKQDTVASLDLDRLKVEEDALIRNDLQVGQRLRVQDRFVSESLIGQWKTGFLEVVNARLTSPVAWNVSANSRFDVSTLLSSGNFGPVDDESNTDYYELDQNVSKQTASFLTLPSKSVWVVSVDLTFDPTAGLAGEELDLSIIAYNDALDLFVFGTVGPSTLRSVNLGRELTTIGSGVETRRQLSATAYFPVSSVFTDTANLKVGIQLAVTGTVVPGSSIQISGLNVSARRWS